MSCIEASRSSCDDGAGNYVVAHTFSATVECDASLTNATYTGYARWTTLIPSYSVLYHEWSRTRAGNVVTGWNKTSQDDVEPTPIEPVTLPYNATFQVTNMALDEAAMYDGVPCKPDVSEPWSAAANTGNVYEENWVGVAIARDEENQITSIFEFEAKWECTAEPCAS